MLESKIADKYSLLVAGLSLWMYLAECYSKVIQLLVDQSFSTYIKPSCYVNARVLSGLQFPECTMAYKHGYYGLQLSATTFHLTGTITWLLIAHTWIQSPHTLHKHTLIHRDTHTHTQCNDQCLLPEPTKQFHSLLLFWFFFVVFFFAILDFADCLTFCMFNKLVKLHLSSAPSKLTFWINQFQLTSYLCAFNVLMQINTKHVVRRQSLLQSK